MDTTHTTHTVRSFTKTQQELASIAGEHDMILVYEARSYWVRTWDGSTFGPMNAKECRIWLAAYTVGAAAHWPGCACGRVACNHRNAALGRGTEAL